MRAALMLGAMIFGAAACSDESPVLRVDERVFANALPCNEQPIPEPDCTDPGAPVGGGINPSDSYATANAVHSITTTVSDDNSGAVSVMPTPDVYFRLEVGYSPSSGLPVFQHVLEPREGGDETIRVIRVEGNAATEIGFDGNPVEPAPSDLDGSEINPMLGMPDLSMFPSLIDAVVSGNGGFFRIEQLAQRMPVNANVLEMDRGFSVRRPDATTIILKSQTDRTSTSEALFSRTSRGEWVLRRIDDLTDVHEGGKHTTITSRLRLKAVRYQRNHAADRQREETRKTRFDRLRDATATRSIGADAQAQPGVALSSSEDSWSRTGIVTWNPPTPVPFPILPPPTQAPNTPSDIKAEDAAGCVDAQFAAANRVEAGSGPRIVFQHGFVSGACTWQFQLPYFSADASGGRVIGSTYWPGTYESQANQLRDQLPTGSSNWVFVGHSNGGIISRYLAQTSTPQLARAVITINSPHSGADLPAATATFLNGTSFIFGVGQAIWNARSMGATSVGTIFSNVSIVGQLLRGDAVVLTQMQPGSTFLNSLAQRSETGFKRYAIRSRISNDWQSVRVLCDARAPTSPGVPAGRACVKNAKRMIERSVFNGGLFKFLAILVQNIPVAGQYIAGGLHYAARANFALTGMMYSIEWKWREAFCNNQPCDGVVRMDSQAYPLANAERVINNADSHVGSTKSLTVTRSLEELILLANQ